MNTDQKLQERSGSTCELCKATNDLKAYPVPPKTGERADENILICSTCSRQIENPDQMDANHWRCLNESMWSEVPAVQVVAWRILYRLRTEG